MKINAIQQDQLKLDSAQAVFFNRQLEEIDQKLYEKRYPDYKFADGQILPITSSVNPGAESYTYTQYDFFGMAKIITSYADDLPRVDISGVQVTAIIKGLGASYGFNVQEVRAAQMAGIPLEDRKAMGTRKTIEQKKDALGFSGDTGTNIKGFNDVTNITEVVLPDSTAVGGSKTFANKTADEIIRDMNSLPTAVLTITLEAESPDTMLLPTAQYQLISTMRIPDTNITIKQFFIENSDYIKEIISVPKLAGAGAGGLDRMHVYRKDPDYIRFEMPVKFELFPPEIRGLETINSVHARVCSVIDYYPLARAYADGI